MVLRWLNFRFEGTSSEYQLKRTGWQKPNHVLTMFSGRPLCQWNGKCQSKWNHGNLVAYAIKKKLANERQPNYFMLLVTLTTFFFPKVFFPNLLFLFFFYQHFLSQHANIYHIVTSRLLLMILIETYGSFLLPFIWYQYVWYCSFLHSFLLLF